MNICKNAVQVLFMCNIVFAITVKQTSNSTTESEAKIRQIRGYNAASPAPFTLDSFGGYGDFENDYTVDNKGNVEKFTFSDASRIPQQLYLDYQKIMSEGVGNYDDSKSSQSETSSLINKVETKGNTAISSYIEHGKSDDKTKSGSYSRTYFTMGDGSVDFKHSNEAEKQFNSVAKPISSNNQQFSGFDDSSLSTFDFASVKKPVFQSADLNEDTSGSDFKNTFGNGYSFTTAHDSDFKYLSNENSNIGSSLPSSIFNLENQGQNLAKLQGHKSFTLIPGTSFAKFNSFIPSPIKSTPYAQTPFNSFQTVTANYEITEETGENQGNIPIVDGIPKGNGSTPLLPPIPVTSTAPPLPTGNNLFSGKTRFAFSNFNTPITSKPFPQKWSLPQPSNFLFSTGDSSSKEVISVKAIPVPVPHPVNVPVPVAIPQPIHFKIPVPFKVEKTVRVPYEKKIPYPVEKPIPVPVHVTKKVPYFLPKPYPVYKTSYIIRKKE